MVSKNLSCSQILIYFIFKLNQLNNAMCSAVVNVEQLQTKAFQIKLQKKTKEHQKNVIQGVSTSSELLLKKNQK